MKCLFNSLQKSNENTIILNVFLEKVRIIEDVKKGINWEEEANNLRNKLEEMKQNSENNEKEKKNLLLKLAKETSYKSESKQLKLFELQNRIETLEGVIHERDAYIRRKLDTNKTNEIENLRKKSEIEKEEAFSDNSIKE